METDLLELIIPAFVENVNGIIKTIGNKLMIYYLYLQIDTNISFDYLKEVYNRVSKNSSYSTSIVDLELIDSDLKITIEINQIKSVIDESIFLLRGFATIILPIEINYHHNVIRYECIIKDERINLIFGDRLPQDVIELTKMGNQSYQKSKDLIKIGDLLHQKLNDLMFYKLLVPQFNDDQTIDDKYSHFYFKKYYSIGYSSGKYIDEYTYLHLHRYSNIDAIKFEFIIYIDRLKRPIDYLSNYSTDMNEKGFSISRILSSPFVCIIHDTYYNSLELILKSEKLNTKPEIAKGHQMIYGGIYGNHESIIPLEKTIKHTQQFPGIYTRLIAQENLRHYHNRRDDSITIILSLSLLKLHNWHWNFEDNYGSINNQTFVPETMVKYLPYINFFWPGYGYPLNDLTSELIFHDGIPIDFIEGLILHDINLLTKIDNLLNNYSINIPVYMHSQKLYDDLIQLQFVKYIETDISILDRQPQLCYNNKAGNDFTYYVHNIPYYPLDAEKPVYNQATETEYIHEKMLKNCGLSPDSDTDAILEKMEDIYFGSGERVPVENEEDLPPFKYTPNYYGIDK